MSRYKTFDSTGLATAGRIYAGDLNAIQDLFADLYNLAQSLGVSSVALGEAGLQLLRYGAGEARLSGHMRVDGILRGLGGLYAGQFTTTARDAIAVGSRPYGLVIVNTTTNRIEWNQGTDATPNWQPVSPPIANGSITLALLAADSVDSSKIVDGSIVAADISGTLKPSVSAAAGTEALRALGTTAATAAAGNDARLSDTRAPTANSVATASIQNGAVTAGKIATDTITANEIAPNAIGSSELADNAVDTAAIAASAVTFAKLAVKVQGGKTAIHSDDTDATARINFPVAFPNSITSVVACNGEGLAHYPCVYGEDTNGFYIVLTGGVSGGIGNHPGVDTVIAWHAVGT